MIATAVSDDEPERPTYSWTTDTDLYRTPPTRASYAELAKVNGRIRAMLAAMKAGSYASHSRDFGRGVAYAARMIEAAMDDKE